MRWKCDGIENQVTTVRCQAQPDVALQFSSFYHRFELFQGFGFLLFRDIFSAWALTVLFQEAHNTYE